MNLLTFSSFLLISLEGLIFESRFLTVKNRIPLKAYLRMVTLFFAVNVINNQAFNYRIPVPLHVIFRSNVKSERSNYYESRDVYLEWFIGMGMLWFGLFFSALLGITQEKMFVKYGKHPKEALFYCHALALPGFVIMANDIYKHAIILSDSETLTVPIVNCGIPKLWLILVMCDVTQYICVRSVYTLTAEYSSLTVTLVVTLRKFLTLMLSIILFKNTFTFYHWIGTAMVFGGTLAFSNIISEMKQAFKKHHQKTSVITAWMNAGTHEY